MGNRRFEINNQIKKLESQKPVFTLEPTRNAFLEANKAQLDFFNGDETKKREVLEKVLWNLSFKSKNIVDYQFKSVFQVLAKAPKNGELSTLLCSPD